MKCYFVVSQNDNCYVIEDLGGSNQRISVRQEGNALSNISNGKIAIIKKFLPKVYYLSPFRNNIGNYTFKDDSHLLYDITESLDDFSGFELVSGDVVATKEWQ